MRIVICPDCGWLYIAPPKVNGVLVCSRCDIELAPATSEQFAHVYRRGGLEYLNLARDNGTEKWPKHRLTLSSYRKLRPGKLAQQRKDLLNLLLDKTGFDDEEGRIALVKAATGDFTAMNAIAEKVVRSGFVYDSDLAWSWIACAAGYGSNLARARIAARLSVIDSTRDRNALILEWLAPLQSTLSSFTTLSKKALAKLVEEIAPPETAPAPTVSTDVLNGKSARTPHGVTTDAPMLQVCAEIQLHSGSSDDRAFVKQWSRMTSPLPLIQGPPSEQVCAVLELEFPWAADAIEAIVGDLALRESMGIPWSGFRPTLLVGPPGTGKTSLARRVATILGMGYGEYSAAGSADNRILAGTARGWNTMTPSLPIHVMRQHHCANPVIIVDEIDKAGGSERNGDVRRTLLAMLEPSTAKRYLDEGLAAPVDLSACSWIITANDVSRIRGPLLTRMRVVEVPLPHADHLDAVLSGVRRDIAGQFGVTVDDIPELMPDVDRMIRSGFKRGVSLRRVRSAYERALLIDPAPQSRRH